MRDTITAEINFKHVIYFQIARFGEKLPRTLNITKHSQGSHGTIRISQMPSKHLNISHKYFSLIPFTIIRKKNYLRMEI